MRLHNRGFLEVSPVVSISALEARHRRWPLAVSQQKIPAVLKHIGTDCM